MLNEIEFNLGISISLIVAAALILTLIIVEFAAYLVANKYLIFKKAKIFNLGWIVNIVVLVIAIAVSILLTVFVTAQSAYIPCVATWWTVTGSAIAILITRTVLTIKSRKQKHEIKDALHVMIDQLANQFDIKNFKEPMINFKHSKKDKWYENIQIDFKEISRKIETLISSGVAFIASEIITFLETYSTTISNKRNKYAYCLFLILLNNLQKKINPDKKDNKTTKK